MAKLFVTFFLCLFSIVTLYSQRDSLFLDNILKKVIKKTKSIQTISYDIEKKWISFGDIDTTISTAYCIIDKKYPDSLFGQHFHLSIEGYDFIYNGSICYRKKTNASIASSLLPSDMDLNFFRGFFLDYWLNHKVVFEKTIGDDISALKYIGVKLVNNAPCYVVEIVSNSDDIECKETVFICKKNYLPIKCIITFNLRGNSMSQYSEKTISNININKINLSSEAFLEKISEITPVNKNIQTLVSNPLSELNIGDVFPSWNSFEVVNSDTQTISKKENTIILADFWYMSCYPCLKSIPQIKELQKDYPNELQVIGFNPYDESRKDLLNDFIKKQNITYPTLFPDIEFIKKINIFRYPTFILIGKDNNVKFIHYGATDDLYNVLKKEISKLLN